jgi:acetyl-CoA carboxylase biotin carboxyl carrier protein
MQFEEVRRLVQLVVDHDIDELDVWRWTGRVRIRKTPQGGVSVSGPHAAPAGSPATPPPASVPPPVESATAPVATTEDENLVPITSPMVGTVYRAPSPDAEPFVQTGDRVEPGQTVCIVEAMKLMNEIQAEVGGRIARILVENAQPVEFGQPLFLIDPR